MCDGYSDCPSGEDESVDVCETYGVVRAPEQRDPGEEPAASALAVAVRRPLRTHPSRNPQKLGSSNLHLFILSIIYSIFSFFIFFSTTGIKLESFINN
jgi:hypothetical protein